MRLIALTATLALSQVALLGCKCNDDAKLPGDDVVLARVGGAPISEYDVTQAIQQTLGDYSAARLDSSGRRTVLESLVASRAIAQAMEDELGDVERLALEKRVTAYREKALVQIYLEKNSAIESVTDEMIDDYYKAHPERFGAKKVRTYEMLATDRSIAGADRAKVLRAVKDASKQSGWSTWVDKLRQDGLPVRYRRGHLGERVLHRKIRRAMETLKKGETSPVTIVEGRVYVMRITGETQRDPKPLADVRADIRRALRPRQIKRAVKKVSANVVKAAEVKYSK